MINVIKKCMMCGKTHQMEVTEEQFDTWRYGDGPIQDRLPGLNPLEREFLMTGYCPECQAMLFGNNYSSDKIRKVG